MILSWFRCASRRILADEQSAAITQRPRVPALPLPGLGYAGDGAGVAAVGPGLGPSARRPRRSCWATGRACELIACSQVTTLPRVGRHAAQDGGHRALGAVIALVVRLAGQQRGEQVVVLDLVPVGLALPSQRLLPGRPAACCCRAPGCWRSPWCRGRARRSSPNSRGYGGSS